MLFLKRSLCIQCFEAILYRSIVCWVGHHQWSRVICRDMRVYGGVLWLALPLVQMSWRVERTFGECYTIYTCFHDLSCEMWPLFELYPICSVLRWLRPISRIYRLSQNSSGETGLHNLVQLDLLWLQWRATQSLNQLMTSEALRPPEKELDCTCRVYQIFFDTGISHKVTILIARPLWVHA